MPTGLKNPTSTVAIGFSATEGGANTFEQQAVDLNLSPLDREVFVVLAIDLNLGEPDSVAGQDTAVSASVTTTSNTAVQNLSNSNCLTVARSALRTHGAATDSGAPFTYSATESPASLVEYIGIIATNDFFVQIQGTGNANPKAVTGKLYGYRAVADASIYSALVQSEVLSA